MYLSIVKDSAITHADDSRGTKARNNNNNNRQ